MVQISQPGVGGDKFDANNHNGHLLLFFPSAFRSGIATVNGEADCVDTRIVDLDTGQVLEDAKVWGKAMVPQLKGAVPDGIVLGRIAQGQNTKGNPPWLLQPFDAQDNARAEAWIAQDSVNRLSQPAAQAPPTQSAPAPTWGQQPPAPAPAAPATGGWGNPPAGNGWGAPAAPAPATSPGAGWGTPANPPPADVWSGVAAAPAPAAPAPAPTATSSGVHPDLAAALAQKGFPVPPGWTQEQAEQAWALVNR
jgi:hypothetical protein